MRQNKKKKIKIIRKCVLVFNAVVTIFLINSLLCIGERKILWNIREIWNTEVSALIGAAISQKYH